jgi:hypothetical protein
MPSRHIHHADQRVFVQFFDAKGHPIGAKRVDGLMDIGVWPEVRERMLADGGRLAEADAVWERRVAAEAAFREAHMAWMVSTVTDHALPHPGSVKDWMQV